MGMIFRDGITIRGRVRAILRDAQTGEVRLITPWNHNLIPTVGLRAMARRYGGVGSLANEGQVTYGAVGNGANTPAESDTTMQNEIARKAIATSSESGAVITIETFFTSAEANALITKFALFGEAATASANTGTMMEYADFSVPFTKTSNETLTVEAQITFVQG